MARLTVEHMPTTSPRTTVSAPGADGPAAPAHPRFTDRPVHGHAKTLRAAGDGTGAQQTRVRVRDFTFVSDEPVAIGGRDEGPTPMEYLAGAVNSCITVVIDQLAERRGLPLSSVQTYTLAKQDTRGLAGSADVQPYAYEYRLQIVLATTERDQAALIGFAATAEHTCPAINLLRDAHTGLDVVWSFTDERVDHAAEFLANEAYGYTTEGARRPEPFLTVINADGAGRAVEGAGAGRLVEGTRA